MSKIIRMILITVAVAMFFTGCRVQYVPVPVKVDSIYVEKIVERVDTIKVDIPGETVYVIKRDSSHLESAVAISDAKIDSSGFLHHSLVNKKGVLKKEVVYKDKIIEKIVEKEVPVIKEIEKEVKVIPGYYKTISIVFWSMILGVLLFLLVKFKVF